MRRYAYYPEELAGLPGMPKDCVGVINLLVRQGWPAGYGPDSDSLSGELLVERDGWPAGYGPDPDVHCFAEAGFPAATRLFIRERADGSGLWPQTLQARVWLASSLVGGCRRLAQCAGVSVSSLRRWARGRPLRGAPDIGVAIASAAGVNPRWLIFGEGNALADDFFGVRMYGVKYSYPEGGFASAEDWVACMMEAAQ